MKVFIGKSKDLDVKEMAVLSALNGLHSKKQEYLITSVEAMVYFLSKRFLKKSIKKDRIMIGNIKSGIQSLAERKIITILDQSEDNYVISNEGLEVNTDNEKFVIVELWEMQKIL